MYTRVAKFAEFTYLQLDNEHNLKGHVRLNISANLTPPSSLPLKEMSPMISASYAGKFKGTLKNYEASGVNDWAQLESFFNQMKQEGFRMFYIANDSLQEMKDFSGLKNTAISRYEQVQVASGSKIHRRVSSANF